MMPPLVYETVAWFRHYSWIPVPPLPGETDVGAVPDPARSARAAPIAGAIIGLVAGVAMVLAAALGASAFVSAAAAVLLLIVITGGRAEQTLAAITGRSTGEPSARALHPGVFAVSLVVLARAGVLHALLPFGAWGTALALAGAVGFSHAAAVGFTLLRPRPGASDAAEAPVASATLQWLAIAGLVVAILPVLPFFGLAAAAAGIAAAAGAVALVSAFLPRDPGGNELGFLAVAALAAEVAFLFAVRAFL